MAIFIYSSRPVAGKSDLHKNAAENGGHPVAEGYFSRRQGRNHPWSGDGIGDGIAPLAQQVINGEEEVPFKPESSEDRGWH